MNMIKDEVDIMIKGPEELGKLGFSALKGLITKPVEQVISVDKEGAGWRVVMEVLERRAVPNSQDLLSRYEMKFTAGGKLLSYRQIMLRHRIDLIKEEKGE